jgi:hypothetical protein
VFPFYSFTAALYCKRNLRADVLGNDRIIVTSVREGYLIARIRAPGGAGRLSASKCSGGPPKHRIRRLRAENQRRTILLDASKNKTAARWSS